MCVHVEVCMHVFVCMWRTWRTKDRQPWVSFLVLSSLLPPNTRCLTSLVLTMKAGWAVRPLCLALGLQCMSPCLTIFFALYKRPHGCAAALYQPSCLSISSLSNLTLNFQISRSWLWAVWIELWALAIPQEKGFILAQDAEGCGVRLGGHVSQGPWAALT